MSRNITKIKRKHLHHENDISVVILAAGLGSKIKSYEPRSLLKIKGKNLIDHQIDIIKEHFYNPEIISVVGCHANKMVKKLKDKTRIVENQIYDTTNSSESLRIGFNNSVSHNFMFMHGDLYFNYETIDVDYSRSFIVTSPSNMIKDNEVGLTKENDVLAIMSYGLPIKWGQIAFFTGREYRILKAIMQKFELKDRKKLSFEIINAVVQQGGIFHCYEPKKMKILEIDRIKDIKND
jgi:CTP:phosphocholine cytidylyltransferase-like protein